MTDYMGWLERERGLRFDDYARPVALVGRRPRGVLDLGRRLLRHPAARHVGPRPGRARRCPARAGSRARSSTTPRSCSAGWRRIARRSCSSPSGTRCARSVPRELRDSVAAVAAGLRRLGVGRGDRVVAVIPNIPEAVVALLACASLGAIWASCSPDFGTRGLIDRFAQISPKVLIAVDGYTYGGKPFDRREVVDALRAELPTLERTVLIPYLDPAATADRPGRDVVGGPDRRRPRSRSPSNPSRSTTRCGSSIRRARPVCRRRSSTATAASCSSTRRRSA